MSIWEDLPLPHRPIRFPDGNEIPYGQDFCIYHGIPSDRDFAVVQIWDGLDGGVWFEAPGYGAKGDYGNGRIFVRWPWLTPWFPPERREG